MIFPLSRKNDLNDFLNAFAIGVTAVAIRLLAYYVMDNPPMYSDNEWYFIIAEIVFMTFWFWAFFSFLSKERAEFEADLSYHRRRGKAAVEKQNADEEAQKVHGMAQEASGEKSWACTD